MQHYSLCNLRGRARKRACSVAAALREMGPSKTLARSGQASQLVEEEPAAEEEDVVAPSASRSSPAVLPPNSGTVQADGSASSSAAVGGGGQCSQHS